jgi:hypothetical protein
MLVATLIYFFTLSTMHQRYQIQFLLLLATSLLLGACAGKTALPAHAFEGTITQTIHLQGLTSMMQDKSKGIKTDSTSTDTSVDVSRSGLAGMLGAASNVSLKMYVREDKVAYEVSVLGGLFKMRSIIDRGSRTLTLLLPNQQALVTSLKGMDSIDHKLKDSMNAHPEALDSLSAYLPQPTGKKQTIHGFETEEYRGKVNGMDVDMWLTSDPRMKFYDVIRDAFLGRGRTGTGGLERLFAMIAPVSGGKVPIKTEVTSNGQVIMSSEVSEIQEEKIDDAIFQIPENYERVQSDSMMMRTKHIDTEKD